jgi:hypothetical protein
MTWTRQQRHKARSRRIARDTRLRQAGEAGTHDAPFTERTGAVRKLDGPAGSAPPSAAESGNAR